MRIVSNKGVVRKGSFISVMLDLKQQRERKGGLRDSQAKGGIG